MAIRLSVLVDGFNLYHSIEELIHKRSFPAATKWLDLVGLANSFLHQIEIPGRKEVVSVDYFTAYAHHKMEEDPLHVKRHEIYMRALADSGVKCHIHRFKKRHKNCKVCGERFKFHEEKETDVAMAIKLLRIFVEKQADVAVLVTGDTDIAPAVRAVLDMFPEAVVWFAFPYERRNKELAGAVQVRGGSFKIGEKAYERHRLPDPYPMKVGDALPMPVKWRSGNVPAPE